MAILFVKPHQMVVLQPGMAKTLMAIKLAPESI
jgi:hypothetical protein